VSGLPKHSGSRGIAEDQVHISGLLGGEDQPGVTLAVLKAKQDFGERAKACKNSEDQKKVRVAGATTSVN
jgi:hypothetical protein